MPQMAPILWLNMMFMFILVFLVVMIINYYTPPSSKMASTGSCLSAKQNYWSW